MNGYGKIEQATAKIKDLDTATATSPSSRRRP